MTPNDLLEKGVGSVLSGVISFGFLSYTEVFSEGYMHPVIPCLACQAVIVQ